MLAALRAIVSPFSSLKSTLVIEALISSAFSLKKHEPYLFIALNVLRPPRNLAETARKVRAIKKLIIVLVALNFKALP